MDPENLGIRQLLRLTAEISGFPRHLSQQVGGFVLTRGELSRIVPIENASMVDRSVIQWDKGDIEALGSMKVDVLAWADPSRSRRRRRRRARRPVRRGCGARPGAPPCRHRNPGEQPWHFRAKPFEEIPDEDWRRFFDVNLLSGVRLSRLVLPAMRRANWGRVVFIASESALQTTTEVDHYGMTKTAQIAVARGIAESVAGTGITVNSVLPGPTKSRGVTDFVEDMARDKGQDFAQVEAECLEHVRPTSLIKRFTTLQETAPLVA